MADLTHTNTFAGGTKALAAEVNTNFTDTRTYVNARNNGTAWDDLAVTGQSILTGGILNLLDYRRPDLEFISITQIDVENNTGTSNETRIIFPDGTVRDVVEDTSSANKFRRFDITATAEFTSGTEDSGLRSSLSEATNTWYAIYAVKSTIDSTKFVLVGDTVLPLQTNFATLNSSFGTDGWIYLGLIRNGDNSGATGDILDFRHSGYITNFINDVTGSAENGHGIRLANTAGATSLTYTFTAGTGTTDIPDHLKYVIWHTASAATGNTADEAIARRSTGARPFYYRLNANTIVLIKTMEASTLGFQIATAASVAHDIHLSGYIDPILGSGVNPKI